MGRIGQALARRARAFGLQVHYHNRRRVAAPIEETLEATYWDSLDQMLARMDIVSVNCPHTPATYHLLSARRLKLLKPDAIVVNTARGEIIDENALTRMLEAGEIAGAGLDVFEHEPAISPRLLKLARQASRRGAAAHGVGHARRPHRHGREGHRQHQDLHGRPPSAGPGPAVDAVTGVIDHVCIRVPDLAAARRFYDAVLGALGLPCVGADDTWIGYGLRAEAGHPHRTYVSIRKGTPAGAGFLWAFRARDAAAVAAFEAAGLAAGGPTGADRAVARAGKALGRPDRSRRPSSGGRRRRLSAARGLRCRTTAPTLRGLGLSDAAPWMCRREGLMGGWIILGILVVGALWLITVYNGLVSMRQRVSQAFADIDVQLKQRHDLIPNLVETVKGYATHEKGTLEAVVQARNAALAAQGPQAQAAAEGQLGAALGRLIALSEAYPDLKANTNFQQLQMDLSDIENKLAAARRFFNNAVSEYNASIQAFPAALFARNMGFAEREFFDVGQEARQSLDQAPTVKF